MFTGQNCVNVVQQYAPNNQMVWKYRYGTSGFRGDHKLLDMVYIRVGLLAVLRSFATSCQAIGIMVTASHNPQHDNGVKIIDPTGDMLDHSWENIAAQTVNKSQNDVLNYLQQQYDELNIKRSTNDAVTIFIGRDTRPHSLRFSQLIHKAVKSVNSKVVIKDFGEVTTPQMHYLVRRANGDIGIHQISSSIYLNDVIKSYKQLIKVLASNKTPTRCCSSRKLFADSIVDCANGVGGLVFNVVKEELSDLIDINLIHLPSSRVKVNDKCGAEHVHKKICLPHALIGKEEEIKNIKIASVDGDCDRLIYYYIDADNDNKFRMFDGDKQTCLLFKFLHPFIVKCGVKLSIGVVQTAYANGSSTSFIKDSYDINPILTPTGTKFLHVESHKYDVSVWYESNGHGCVTISDDAVKKLKQRLYDGTHEGGNDVDDVDEDNKMDEDEKRAINILLLIHLVSNQAVGDGLTDWLLIEAALYYFNWNINDWDNMYIDKANILTKLKVKDRTIFKTTYDEQICIEPKGLQNEINKIIKKYGDNTSRSFVRPSGTEDIVRIYTESKNKNDVEKISLMVKRAVYDIAGGLGNRP